MTSSTEVQASDGALNRKGEPRCIRPWYFGWPVWLITLCVISVPVIWVCFRIGGIGFFAMCAAIMLPNIAAWLVRWMLFDRFLLRLGDRAIEARLALCLRCGYSLTDLPQEHCCPECGQAYDLEKTVEHWGRWLNKLRHRADRFWLRQEKLKEWELLYKPCRGCSRSLTGSESTLCPECGTVNEYL